MASHGARRWLAGTALAVVFVLVAALPAPVGPPAVAPVGAAAVAESSEQPTQGWVTHRDLLGFTLRHPPDWAVVSSQSGVISVSNGDAFVLATPLLLNRTASSESVLRDAVAAYADRFPRARVESQRRVAAQPDTSVAAVAYRGDGGPGRAVVLAWVADRSAMVAAVAAPEAAFDDLRPTMVAILRSLAFDEGEWVPWDDPLEHAFSLNAPRGWTVDGGMYRYAPVDTRADWTATSPDGAISVSSGDHEIPTYIDPSALRWVTSAFPVGSWYPAGGGVQMMVRPYTTGLAYAERYAREVVGERCGNLRLVERNDRADIAALLRPVVDAYRAMGVSLTYSVGEVRLNCQSNRQPREGYVLVAVATLRDSGLWFVGGIGGYLASPDLTRQAEAVHSRVQRSVTPNPRWIAMQQNITATQSRISAETNAQIAQTISTSYWNRQATADDLSRKWSNAILGQTDVVDPDTGVTWKVSSGHNYYWAPAGGTGGPNAVVGTNTADPPDIDYTPLLEF